MCSLIVAVVGCLGVVWWLHELLSFLVALSPGEPSLGVQGLIKHIFDKDSLRTLFYVNDTAA
jgi:hypothetical protein